MIKDIMVHLDGDDPDELRLGHAARIAEIFEAHVTGLYTNIVADPLIAYEAGATGVELAEDLLARAREAGDRIARVLGERLDKLVPRAELRRIDVYSNELAQVIARQTRWIDIFVAIHPFGGTKSEHGPTVVDAALFGSARGVYVVPDGPVASGPYRRILIAWNNSREAARALAEATPFLKRADRIHLGLVDENNAEARGEETAADIGRHLDRLGLATEIRHIAGWRSAAEALLNEIQRLGVDLMVMGGYGHSRVRERVFGGTTRAFLTRSPIPVLMAH